MPSEITDDMSIFYRQLHNDLLDATFGNEDLVDEIFGDDDY